MLCTVTSTVLMHVVFYVLRLLEWCCTCMDYVCIRNTYMYKHGKIDMWYVRN